MFFLTAESSAVPARRVVFLLIAASKRDDTKWAIHAVLDKPKGHVELAGLYDTRDAARTALARRALG